MKLSVDEEKRKQLNLSALQRIDKSTVDIIGLATHVVLYEFSTSDNHWTKCNVEGSLFVTKRGEAPRFKLIVLNRNSTHNLEIPIHSSFEMQLREPYLIFRDKVNSEAGSSSAAQIRGFWFHDGEERNVMFSLLQKVVQSATHVAEVVKTVEPNISYAQKVNLSTNNTDKTPNSKVKTTTTTNQSPQVGNAAATTTTTTTTTARSVNVQDATAALMGALSITPSKHQQSSFGFAPNQGSVGGAMTPTTLPLLSPQQTTTTTTTTTRQSQAQQPNIPPPTTPQNGQPTMLSPNHKTIVFDKKSLQLSLLSLIQDDRFLDLIHAQYLKVAHARANRDANAKNIQNQKNGPN